MNLLEGGERRGREDGGQRVGRGRREGGERGWGGDVGERGRVGREGGVREKEGGLGEREGWGEREGGERDLTRFNKIATQGAPQMAVDKEANSLSRVYSYYYKFNLRLFYV